MGLETYWARQPHIFIELCLWPTTETPKSIFQLWFELSGLATYEDPTCQWNVKSPRHSVVTGVFYSFIHSLIQYLLSCYSVPDKQEVEGNWKN